MPASPSAASNEIVYMIEMRPSGNLGDDTSIGRMLGELGLDQVR